MSTTGPDVHTVQVQLWAQSQRRRYVLGKMSRKEELQLRATHSWVLDKAGSPHKMLFEHSDDAERLAGKRRGVLPGPEWLQKNGYGELVKAMQEHPKVFAHIRQEGKRKTLAEHVQVADRLAKKRGGVLPGPYWLDKNGYGGLRCTMRKYPETFAHLPQERKYRTLPEHVQDAGHLAAKNGGIMPSPGWLTTHGHSGLRAVMRKDPAAFVHIPQVQKVDTGKRPPKEPKYRNLTDHVRDAKRLAEENGGVLPARKWLLENGQHTVYRALNRYPAAFAHIPQRGRHRTLTEHVEDAGRLAGESKGFLPGPGWLDNNGYSGLAAVIRKHPGAFAHIPRRGL